MLNALMNSPSPRVYMANPGNLGDALIRQGTIKLFKTIGLTYKEIRKPPQEMVGTFIFGGGGAWCKNWNHQHFVSTGALKSETTIVLPSTYAIRSTLFDKKNILFFCRDMHSQRFCKNAIFNQDMAFYLKDLLHPIKGNGTGYFMRLDKERNGSFNIPPGNIDISVRGQTYDDTRGFIESINNVRIVHTDRLHVAITACMLKKKIYLYPGNYFKNKEVFLSSMKGFFDVTFREHDSR